MFHLVAFEKSQIKFPFTLFNNKDEYMLKRIV